MFAQRSDHASVAKAQVDKWFGQATVGPVFLARDKAVYRLSPEEVERLREDAIADVIILQMRMRTRTYVAIFLVIFLFIALSSWSRGLDAPWNEIVNRTGYAIYSAHGVWIFYEAYKIDRAVKAVRDRIASSLKGRVPLPEMITEHLTRTNPFTILLTGIVIFFVALSVVAEMLAHRGIDLITILPPWMLFAVLPVAWGLYFLGKHFDRSRGVGS